MAVVGRMRRLIPIIVTHYKKSAVIFRSDGYSGHQEGAPKIMV
jgi:hypothetical protein